MLEPVNYGPAFPLTIKKAIGFSIRKKANDLIFSFSCCPIVRS